MSRYSSLVSERSIDRIGAVLRAHSNQNAEIERRF
jgi:hypothetical protein